MPPLSYAVTDVKTKKQNNNHRCKKEYCWYKYCPSTDNYRNSFIL